VWNHKHDCYHELPQLPLQRQRGIFPGKGEQGWDEVASPHKATISHNAFRISRQQKPATFPVFQILEKSRCLVKQTPETSIVQKNIHVRYKWTRTPPNGQLSRTFQVTKNNKGTGARWNNSRIIERVEQYHAFESILPSDEMSH
jgi:hypothetical protein